MERAMSSASATTRDDLVPRAGSSSNSVTTGPGLISRTSPLMEKSASTSSSRRAVPRSTVCVSSRPGLGGGGPLQQVERRRAVARALTHERQGRRSERPCAGAAPRLGRSADLDDSWQACGVGQRSGGGAWRTPEQSARRWRGFRRRCRRRTSWSRPIGRSPSASLPSGADGARRPRQRNGRRRRGAARRATQAPGSTGSRRPPRPGSKPLEPTGSRCIGTDRDRAARHEIGRRLGVRGPGSPTASRTAVSCDQSDCAAAGKPAAALDQAVEILALEADRVAERGKAADEVGKPGQRKRALGAGKGKDRRRQLVEPIADDAAEAVRERPAFAERQHGEAARQQAAPTRGRRSSSCGWRRCARRSAARCPRTWAQAAGTRRRSRAC